MASKQGVLTGTRLRDGVRRWEVRAFWAGSRLTLSGYDTQEAGAEARDRLLRHLGAPRARLNFPERHLEPASLETLRAEVREQARKRFQTRYGSGPRAGVEVVADRHPSAGEDVHRLRL